MINHNEKEYICVCITESLGCTSDTNTTLYINNTSIKHKLKKLFKIHKIRNQIQKSENITYQSPFYLFGFSEANPKED